MSLMNKHNKIMNIKNLVPDSDYEIQSPRIVLFEKTNKYLVDVIKDFENIELISNTEVVPLENGEFMIYQESEEFAKKFFERFVTWNSQIITARVVIFKKLNSDNISNINERSLGISYKTNLNFFTNNFSFGHSSSYLLFIPASKKAKNTFLKYCLMHKHSFFLKSKDVFMEHLPIFKYPFFFNSIELEEGSFLSKSGKFNFGIFKPLIIEFNSYVSYYNAGIWESVTNKELDLNGKFLKNN